MVNRKKTKEGKIIKSEQENVTSNMENGRTKIGEEVKKGPSMEDYEKSELNSKAAELEKISQEGIPDSREQVADSEPKERKPKLHVLADDRLNSLINRTNELGITDIVQILNSDKFGQFYLVYKE